ncbi:MULTISPECIES: TetR/AcrR family transcriptional regulator [unclassified Pseudomonas]|uniref:TetR/AcrR family transcriptional regulator n=1 Tax=unclassified Pseudomonas TaxID=196821 RepID=UPI0021BB2357|nr:MULTISPECIES: TetR/AcrR family transcriptional regulator [unclassified Pseudomonas]MCT8166802.1 TetR/AcrR family transcriptional regulator [Pseudomonas sp. HD6422]MCT8185698.1 TetR/AcrR family transcriptional regulator [Pseudomonas sp. HD6421]
MKATTKMAEPTGRSSLEGWLDAAYESLTESGVEAVRVMPLAKKLNVSRTSFYWFFEDRDALLGALIERWKGKNTFNLIAQSEAYAEFITEAILNVFDCWLNSELFDSQFEFAMRSWALQSAEVAQEISQADAQRVEALRQMFERFGFDQDAAVTRARSIYLTQIGYISMKTQETLSERMRYIPEYLRIFTGREPEARELQRFCQRNGFSSADLDGRAR